MSFTPSSVLGIDLGTSSVKTVLVDADGRTLAQANALYSVDSPQPGWSETNPEAWWAAVVQSIRQVVEGAGAQPTAIGLSGQMHGVVVADAVGRPVRPAMLWSDTRAVDELEFYRGLTEQVRQRLGNPLTPGMAGPMLAWLARHEPGCYRSARWALQPKDWIRARLTGVFHSEPSDASATLLYDLSRQDWDRDVAAAVHIDPALLPPLLPSSGTPAGQLRGDAADELGLIAGIMVAAGAADTAAAALGSGLVDPGAVQLTIGTGAQLVTPCGAPTGADLAARLTPTTHLYRSATDTGWYTMAAVLNGGLTLNWVRTVMDASWSELYSAAERPGRRDDPIFVPHLHGERTPYMDASLRASWTGLTPRHDRTAMLRAALEGVAFAIGQARDELPDSPSTELRLAGGGTTSPAWRQLLADVLGVRLLAVDIPGASGRGAAMLGARAAGWYDEPGMLEAVKPTATLVAAPRPDAAELRDDRAVQFHRAFQALRPDGPDKH